MAAVWRVLSPSPYKLIFVVGWLLYSIVAILQHRFDISAIAINLLWPFAVFYLLGCGLVYASKSVWPPLHEWQLIAVGIFWALIDHLAKMMAIAFIPVDESIPIVLNRLHLVQTQNTTGPWVFATAGSAPVVLPAFILSVVLLLGAPLFFRFYSVNHRQSYWSRLAFVCLIASSLSSAVDLGVRGGVVDYLYIPGLFAADLKDLISEVFVSSALIEALDNPKISFKWNGWQSEIRDMLDLARRFFRFAVSKLLRMR